MQPFLRGVFLTSDRPEATAKFYREVARIDLEQIGSEDSYTYWRYDKDNFQIAIHDAAKFSQYTHPVISESNLTHLYFKIDNQETFLSHIAELGITPFLKDDVVITIKDPDGRKVMFGTA